MRPESPRGTGVATCELLSLGTKTNSFQPAQRDLWVKGRASLLREIREFFAERKVLEVTTPTLGAAGVTDVNMVNLTVPLPNGSGLSADLTRIRNETPGREWKRPHISDLSSLSRR